jgi:hypothetical protein
MIADAFKVTCALQCLPARRAQRRVHMWVDVSSAVCTAAQVQLFQRLHDGRTRLPIRHHGIGVMFTCLPIWSAAAAAAECSRRTARRTSTGDRLLCGIHPHEVHHKDKERQPPAGTCRGGLHHGVWGRWFLLFSWRVGRDRQRDCGAHCTRTLSLSLSVSVSQSVSQSDCRRRTPPLRSAAHDTYACESSCFF